METAGSVRRFAGWIRLVFERWKAGKRLMAAWRFVRQSGLRPIWQSALRPIWHLPRNLLAVLIRFYQRTLSPDHGFFKRFYPYGYCKFNPSCSDYAHESVKKYGVVWGGVKAIWRVIRCNPCSKGGVDEVV